MTLNSLIAIREALETVIEQYETYIDDDWNDLNAAKEALDGLEKSKNPDSGALRRQRIAVTVKEDCLKENEAKLRAYTTALEELEQTDFHPTRRV